MDARWTKSYVHGRGRNFADVLEALSSLGTTLVEDSVADITLTYYESLSQPERESGSDAD